MRTITSDFIFYSFRKKTQKPFFDLIKSLTFAPQLSSGVMVALRILVPPVRVRVLPGQQKITEDFE